MSRIWFPPLSRHLSMEIREKQKVHKGRASMTHEESARNGNTHLEFLHQLHLQSPQLKPLDPNHMVQIPHCEAITELTSRADSSCAAPKQMTRSLCVSSPEMIRGHGRAQILNLF